MRLLLAAAATLSVCLPAFGQARPEPRQPTASEQKGMNELGESFLTAIKKDDAKLYLQCWIQIEDIEEAMKKSPGKSGENASGELAFYREYLKRRNEIIRFSFPPLRRALIDLSGSLDKLQVKNVSGSKVTPLEGTKRVSSLAITLAAPNGAEIEYRIDDGCSLDARWYFADQPDLTLTLSQDGKKRLVSLGKYMTADEKAKAKSLIPPQQ